MNFPTFNVVQFVDKEGFLTASMQSYHDEMNQELRNGLSDNGWTIPNITATSLLEIAPKMPNGTEWYESDAHELVVKINGALRKVTTTAYP